MFQERMQKNQSVVGFISWLVQSTHPDLAPLHTFLSTYSNKPSHSHWNAAIYMLYYIHLTANYDISFTSTEKAPLHTYMHFPHSSDTEDYGEMLFHPNQHNTISLPLIATHAGAFNMVTWSGQVSNYLYLNSEVWVGLSYSNLAAHLLGKLSDRSKHHSVHATLKHTLLHNAGCCLTMNFRNMISHLSSLGYPITDTDLPLPVYNDSKGCVKWCHNFTTKGYRHIKHHKNVVKEWVKDGSISISHISGRTNPSEIFTK